MKKHLLLGIFVLSALYLSAEDAKVETSVVQMETLKKTSVESARFEILANDRIAFKLDKFTGDVYEFLSSGLFSLGNWVLMERNLGNLKDLVRDNEINYQLFMHEENGTYIFLMNVLTFGNQWKM